MTASLLRCALLATALSLPGLCFAQASNTDRVISLVVPYPAGGPSDLSARSALAVLQRELKQTIIVENIGGAGGTIGIKKVLAGSADGRQIIVGTPSETVLAPLALAVATHKPADLRMVAQLSYTRMVLVSRHDLGIKNFSALAATMRDPSKRELSYGSFGIGSVAHFMFEDLKAQTGARLTHVPYKGTGPMIQDLMGSQIDLGFVPLIGNVLEMIRTGKLYPLMLTDNVRNPKLPDVPAAAEFKELKGGFDYTIWGGMFVPKATPEPEVARLSAAMNAVLRDPDYRKMTEDSGATVSHAQTLEQAAALYRAEAEKYRRIATTIKLEPQ
ncbi:MAG: tripartite tricarboxylate transporter substrate binding protein [Pseudomonadota bacterium]